MLEIVDDGVYFFVVDVEYVFVLRLYFFVV